MNRNLIGVCLLAACGCAFLVPWGGDAAAAETVAATELYAVQRGDLRITLVENGTMVAKESMKVTTKIRNESKILSLIEEGKEVAEGDVVCKLDSGPLSQQIEQIQLDILATEANLKSARTELEIQEVEAAANVRKAEVALDKAKKEAEKYRDGEAPQQRTKLEVALKDAETEYNRKKKNLEDSKMLLDQNYIKRSELEDHQIAYDRAKVQKEGAQNDLDIFHKYTLPMAMTDLQTKLEDAEREVDTAKKRGDSSLGQKRVAVQQVEKRLKQQQKQLEERQEDLANMTLKAPCPGIVVHGNPHEPWYRERVKVGNSVYGGMTLLTIPDLRVMQVKLQVHEADISKLKPGQKATVTADSYPGVQLAGEITKIATVANGNNDWGGSSEVKKFDVEITLQPPGVQLRPGISAKVEIHVDLREQVLSVPLQSVFAEDGSQWCHVHAPGTPTARRKIVLGAANDNFVEVLEGLEAGEQVLLYNPLLPAGGESGGGAGDEKKQEQPAPEPTPAAAAGPGPAAAKAGS
jgi:RND family efflux transporter MFP subunit